MQIILWINIVEYTKYDLKIWQNNLYLDIVLFLILIKLNLEKKNIHWKK